ncbi:hypothetical protein DEIGR_400106 [Deinococcus grandis]|uniref:Uncharacterized protein n=1 Tax=Deinococcus grandis TaxID=57498 RepID=A0A100HNH5_9DEIO|nr:hypothetical protein [Deinococcus grandis]GAQ23973.1 hypothetical protein DEIGR_400106 [Deinococcus grandis]
MTQQPTPVKFRVQMAQEHDRAKIHGVPYNLVKPDAVITNAGHDYSVDWFQVEFDNMSPTRIYSVTIICRDTGHRVSYRVIEKNRRARGRHAVHFNCAFIGMNVRSREEAQDALVAATAAARHDTLLVEGVA